MPKLTRDDPADPHKRTTHVLLTAKGREIVKRLT